MDHSATSNSFRLSYARSVGGVAASTALQALFDKGASPEEIDEFIKNCRSNYGPGFAAAIGVDQSSRKDRYGCSHVVIDEE